VLIARTAGHHRECHRRRRHSRHRLGRPMRPDGYTFGIGLAGALPPCRTWRRTQVSRQHSNANGIPRIWPEAVPETRCWNDGFRKQLSPKRYSRRTGWDWSNERRVTDPSRSCSEYRPNRGLDLFPNPCAAANCGAAERLPWQGPSGFAAWRL